MSEGVSRPQKIAADSPAVKRGYEKLKQQAPMEADSSTIANAAMANRTRTSHQEHEKITGDIHMTAEDPAIIKMRQQLEQESHDPNQAKIDQLAKKILAGGITPAA